MVFRHSTGDGDDNVIECVPCDSCLLGSCPMSSGVHVFTGPPWVAGLVMGVVISATQVRFHVCNLEDTIYTFCEYAYTFGMIWPLRVSCGQT